MRILITGGAGYIGSEIVEYLLFPDNQVTVLDNLMYEHTTLLRYAQNKNFTFVKGDVRNLELLEKLVSQHDVIIPLAALVGFPLCDEDPRAAQEINHDVNTWIACNKSKDQLVIYPCTNSGYGVSVDGSVCTEQSPLNPVSLYGKTKVAAESDYRGAENHVTFRLATVFGPSPRMRSDLLVNYVHIADVCGAFRFVLDHWETCKNETYNVGNDSLNMNKLQLAKKIKEHLPLEIIKAEFTSDPDTRDYIVSSQKIYDKGFKCQFDLDDGVRQLITAYSMIDAPWYGNY
jgi:nucleoside-diphosphate-sugar epimerase